MTFKSTSSLAMALTLTGCCLLTACSPDPAPKTPDSRESFDPSDELKQEIQTKAIKNFPSTANDAHDIKLLVQYEQNFNAVSTELEQELDLLKEEGQLTEEMTHQRKGDLIQSSLNMLKELDLQTEQGRYIQGLFSLYWENQAHVYDELQHSKSSELKNPKDAIAGMGDYYTAQAQLKHWQHQVAKNTSDTAATEASSAQ